VQTGDEIKNVAVVKADNYPDQTLTNVFQVLVNVPVGTSVPRTGGTIAWILLILGLVAGGGYYYYKKNGKLGKFFVPARTKEDDSK
jgi:LPXTG-motif cell wall-anchored protein